MNKQFVWVFGASAVGKKTFINNLTPSLSRSIGLNLMDNISIYKTSLKKRGEDNVNVLKENDIYDFCTENSSLLIKTQWTELNGNKNPNIETTIPYKLKEVSEDDDYHRIIFLHIENNNNNLYYSNVEKRQETWTYEKRYLPDTIDMCKYATSLEQEGFQLEYIEVKENNNYQITNKKICSLSCCEDKCFKIN